MSTWSIYHDGSQRRREGAMTLSVLPREGGYKWIIARNGAVIAGGWAPRSFKAKDDADAAAEKEVRHAEGGLTMYRKLHESLLDDQDIRIALVQKIMREGAVSVSFLGADHPVVSVEWRGVTASVRDDGAYGPFDSETDYLDLWDDDRAQYHKEVPISHAADMIVNYMDENYRRSLGMCAKED